MDAISAYLCDNYDGDVFPLKSGYCPNCFAGGDVKVHTPPSFKHKQDKAAIKERKLDFWLNLFESKQADPIATINAFVPSANKSIPHFSRVVLDLSSPGEPCENQQMCHTRCLLCASLVESHTPAITTAGDPGFKIHNGCCFRCSFVEVNGGKQVQCRELVPSIKLSIDLKERPEIMCKEHARVMREGKVQGNQGNQGPKVSAQDPQQYVQADQVQQPKKPKKKPPTPARPSKLERDSEKGRSHDIVKFFVPAGVKKLSEVGYSRPTLVITPHPQKKGQQRKRRVVSSDEDEDN